MYIETVRNRNSPPAILLREGWREGKKVRKRTLANLSHLPKNIIELIRRALKGEAFVAVSEAFEVIKSSLHGHVNACRTTMRRLRFDKLLASKPCRERNLVEAMVAARISNLTANSRRHGGGTPPHCPKASVWPMPTRMISMPPWIGCSSGKNVSRKNWLDDTSKKEAWCSTISAPATLRVSPALWPPWDIAVMAKETDWSNGLVTDERGCPVAVSVFAGNVG